MAARTHKAPASTRKFGLLRFIAYLYVIIGLLVLIGAILASVITLNAVNNPIVAGGQVIQTGGATAAVGFIVSGVIVALIYVGIGHAILAFLSIEEHTRRSAIAQEQLLRANMRLLRQLDQRLP